MEYMKEAIKEAKNSLKFDEVPVGAVIVYRDKIIARAHNRRETDQNPLAHAEMIAIERASRVLKSWNLSECTMYVTLEPCPMCAGACMQSRLGKVVFGAYEPKSGSLGSVINLSEIDAYTHKMKVQGGVMSQENKEIVQKFFQTKREKSVKVRRMDIHELEDYRIVRKVVFIDEQKVDPLIEYDEYDEERDDVIPVVAVIQNKIVAVCRLIYQDHVMVIGRVATLKAYRGLGIGSKMIKYAIKQAENNGIHTIKLGAQVQALSFYEKLGFEAEGPIYMDAGIEHKDMVLVVRQEQ